jgi:hypothetical protein
VRAGARRGGDAIDRWGRDEGVDRVAGRRDLWRLALEQRDPEVLGGSAAVLQRRLTGGVVAPSVMMMARSGLVVVVMVGPVGVTAVLVIAVRLVGALDMHARVMAVLVIAVLVIAVGVPALQGLVDVDQGVEAGDTDQGQRDRGQACPGSGCAPANHPGIILASPGRPQAGETTAPPRHGAGSRRPAVSRDPVRGGRRMSLSRVSAISNTCHRRSRTGRARDRRRRLLAGAAVALWMLGFELIPGLHIAVHDRLASHDHADAHGRHADAHGGHADARTDGHGPFRGQVQTGRGDRGEHGHADGHRHAGGHDDHRGHELAATVDAGPGPLDSVTPPRPSDRDPGHGAGSLAHRGLAAVDPPPPARLPDLSPVDTSPRPREPSDAPRSSGPLTVRGRGPPSAGA